MHKAVHKFGSRRNSDMRGSEIRDSTCHRHQPRKYGIPYPMEIPCIYSGTRGYDGHFGTSNTSVAHCGYVLEKKCYAGFFFQWRPRLRVFFSVLIISLKKTTNAPKKICRFFKIFSRFRIDMMFLTPDLESTQNLASYRTFRGPNNSLLVKLEFENRFWRKTGFCCSL